MAHPNLNIEPEIIKMKTRDEGIKNPKNQTEKHVYEISLKSL